jgi:hypothetical protein
MSCLTNTIAQSARTLQELIDKIKNASTLALLILAALQLGRVVAVKVVEEVLNERGQGLDEGGGCAECGQPLESKGLKGREMMTLLGLVKWRRRVRVCSGQCASGQVVGSDVALGLQPYQRTSLEVKWLTCALAVFVPFEIAAVLLELLTEVKVESKSIWSWVQHSGQRAMTPVEAQLETLSQGSLPDQEAMSAATQALPLLLGADGVMTPFRPKVGSAKGKTVWREVKVGIWVRLGQRLTQTGQQVTQLTQRLVAVLGDIDELTPRLWLEAVRQGVLSSQQVVWLSDGGRGFWRLFEARFAKYATGILDFYHAAQNLWKGSKVWLDGRTQQARDWFRTARRLLRRGQAHEVLTNIEAALALEGLPDSAYQTLTNLYHYLDKHRDHIDYAKFKELGLPIGSGMVESACKWLIQQRFKGVWACAGVRMGSTIYSISGWPGSMGGLMICSL